MFLLKYIGKVILNTAMSLLMLSIPLGLLYLIMLPFKGEGFTENYFKFIGFLTFILIMPCSLTGHTVDYILDPEARKNNN